MASFSEQTKERDQEDEYFAQAMQLVNSAAMPMAMQSALELGVFEIIAKVGPEAHLSAKEIAAQMHVRNKPDASMILDCILRLLASYSVLTCSLLDIVNGEHVDQIDQQNKSNVELVYGLTPVSMYFLKSQNGGSLAPLMVLAHDKVPFASWWQLKDAILQGGIPFNRVYGMSLFEYFQSNPSMGQHFDEGMLNLTSISMKKILESYKGFEQLKFKHLVDVGGGVGVSLSIITSKYPDIQGTNFDLPHVIEHASNINPGLKHIGGDMFASIPKGDNIFLKRVLHNWGDEDCLKLLKNCYEAIPDDGKVIVVDALLPLVPESSNVVKCIYQMDMIMKTLTVQGKERTQQDFISLANAAGFRGIHFASSVCDVSIMEFFK